MDRLRVDRNKYRYGNYQPGPLWKRTIWYFLNELFIRNRLIPWMGPKLFLLRVFGAKIGRACYLKPGVNIKFPWFLTIGDDSAIGEDVWIDNLAPVTIGNNVTLSQGAMLLTGNHDYTKTSFDLITKPIVIEDGVWIGAKSIVCPGVTCRSHSVLSVYSVATRDLEEYTIHAGQPAEPVRERKLEEPVD